ncbi:MAG: riboflavin synthase [Candidatus Rokuibacteriota bacterium]
MFTGIVEEVGVVTAASPATATARLQIRAAVTLDGSHPGASVAVNGACLTVVERRTDGFAFDVGPETLARTALGSLTPGRVVNLERPLRLGAPLGGHMVLGHVDGVATVADVTRVESTARVRIALPCPNLEPYLVLKGSVAVEGVSLTVAALGSGWFEVMLIPHTLQATTLGRLEVSQAVNVETDVIGKYVMRALSLRGA